MTKLPFSLVLAKWGLSSSLKACFAVCFLIRIFTLYHQHCYVYFEVAFIPRKELPMEPAIPLECQLLVQYPELTGLMNDHETRWLLKKQLKLFLQALWTLVVLWLREGRREKGSISFINSKKKNLSAVLEVKASSYSLVILCLNNMCGVCNKEEYFLSWKDDLFGNLFPDLT